MATLLSVFFFLLMSCSKILPYVIQRSIAPKNLALITRPFLPPSLLSPPHPSTSLTPVSGKVRKAFPSANETMRLMRFLVLKSIVSAFSTGNSSLKGKSSLLLIYYKKTRHECRVFVLFNPSKEPSVDIRQPLTRLHQE